MMDKKVLAVIAVAIIVILAAAIAVLVTSNGDKNNNDNPTDINYKFEYNEDILLTVFGNANGDNAIDSKDVQVINNLVNGKISFDSKKYSFADANNDGKITAEDAAYVQAIIDKDTSAAPKIYYYNVNGDIASVSQPVKKIGADYWPCMDGIVVLGAQDILTHVDSGIYGQLSSNAVKYKGFTQDKVTNFGSGFGSKYDFETVVGTGVDAMVCGSKEIYFVGIEDRFTSASYIDMIRLPFWEGDNVDSAIITLAYLLNNDKYISNAQKFLDYEKRVEAELAKGLAKVSDKKTCLVVYIGSATEKSLEVEIEARGCGSFEWSVLAGMDNVSADINTEGALNSASMYYTTDQDYVITHNPDYVFILGKAGFNRTAEDAQSSFDAGSAYLTTTDSYKNGNIWVSGSGVTSGTMQKTLALMLACQVYPSAFSGVDYNAYLQEFVDTFTLANSGSTSSSSDYFDVEESGIWIYHPTSSAGVDYKFEYNSDVLLTAFGNANGDNAIDSKDVQAINDLLNGKVAFDSKKHSYADANNDGKITAEDAAYVQAIIDKDSTVASKIYYYNVNGDIASVSQPVKKIGADYWPCMDAIVAIGAQDILTHVDSGIYGQLSSNAVKYKGFTQDKVTNFGSGFGSKYDFETVVGTGVDAMVCGSKEIYFVGIEDRFTSSSYIDMIRLPFWEGDKVDSAVVTLAYLLNNDQYISNAQAFLEFEENIEAQLAKGLAKVSDKKTCLVVYIGSATEKSLEVEIEARGCGSFEWSVLAGMDNVSSDINTEGALNSASMYYTTDQDYVITHNPDYVFILGKAGFNRTAEDAQSSFNAGSAYLTTTDSYKNGNIWVSGSGVTSGTMQKTLALMLACQVYEDAFSGVDYNDYLQEFVDTFTLANSGSTSSSSDYFDVEKSGIWIYHPVYN